MITKEQADYAMNLKTFRKAYSVKENSVTIIVHTDIGVYFLHTSGLDVDLGRSILLSYDELAEANNHDWSKHDSRRK